MHCAIHSDGVDLSGKGLVRCPDDDHLLDICFLRVDCWRQKSFEFCPTPYTSFMHFRLWNCKTCPTCLVLSTYRRLQRKLSTWMKHGFAEIHIFPKEWRQARALKILRYPGIRYLVTPVGIYCTHRKLLSLLITYRACLSYPACLMQMIVFWAPTESPLFSCSEQIFIG